MMSETGPKTAYAEAGVADMAARREARAAEQLELLRRHPDCCVVSFTLNIAGPVKRTPLTERAFYTGAARLANAAAAEEMPVRLEKLILANTGAEALFTVRGEAEKVKRALTALEDGSPLGRLFDMDVIAAGGKKLGRSEPRRCLICDEQAAVCARSRKHTVAELQSRTAQIIKEEIARAAAMLAHKALVTEVGVTPKPGLVDRNNCGANPDMDIAMFERSASALLPYFYEIALAVLNGGAGECPLAETAALSSPELASKLRAIGAEAENAMLCATGGVNTHRGAIWSIGILTAAYAHVMASSFETAGEELTAALLAAAAELAETLGDGTEASSKGAQARRRYGVGGPVEEAKAGFPSARLALAAKKEYDRSMAKRGRGAMLNPWAYGLLAVMAELTDNNALRRGGEEGAEFVKARAGELLDKGKTLGFHCFLNEMLAFDRELTERNVSCGGAADMLAAAIFIESAGERYYAKEERFVGSFAKECLEQ
jgi:holo-ACP synthase/triphosphoribosyl-dephospho-CoA synthase